MHKNAWKMHGNGMCFIRNRCEHGFHRWFLSLQGLRRGGACKLGRGVRRAAEEPHVVPRVAESSFVAFETVEIAGNTMKIHENPMNSHENHLGLLGISPLFSMLPVPRGLVKRP